MSSCRRSLSAWPHRPGAMHPLDLPARGAGPSGSWRQELHVRLPWVPPWHGRLCLATSLDLRLFDYLDGPRCCICCNFGPYSAAAAGGAAAFAHVAAARGAHLCAAGEAERRVRGAALMLLDQLHGGMRGRRWRGVRQPFGILMLERCGLSHCLRVRFRQLSRVVAGQRGVALGGGQDAKLGPFVV